MISHKRYKNFVADLERGRLVIPTIWKSSDGAPFSKIINIPLPPARLDRLATAEEIGVIFWRKKPIYTYGKKYNHKA